MTNLILLPLFLPFPEQATSELLPTEDWGLNMEICDFINSSEEYAKDAAKAIRKRLAQTPKNYKVIMYTLIVRILQDT